MNHFVSSKHLPPKPVVLIAIGAALSLFGDMALYAILPIHFWALGLIPLQVGILLSANRWIRLLTNHLAEKLSGKIDNSILLLAVPLGTPGLGFFLVCNQADRNYDICQSF